MGPQDIMRRVKQIRIEGVSSMLYRPVTFFDLIPSRSTCTFSLACTVIHTYTRLLPFNDSITKYNSTVHLECRANLAFRKVQFQFQVSRASCILVILTTHFLLLFCLLSGAHFLNYFIRAIEDTSSRHTACRAFRSLGESFDSAGGAKIMLASGYYLER